MRTRLYAHLRCGHELLVPDAIATLSLKYGEWWQGRHGNRFKVRGVGSQASCPTCRRFTTVMREEFRREQE